MNIDWSKAPEGTNYRDAGGNWLRFKNNQWFGWSSACGGYWFTIGKHNLQKPLTQKIVSTVADLLDMGYLVSPALHMQFCGRIKRNTEWSGEGLPPVGTVCECHLPGELTNNYSWVEAKVIWHNGPTECAVIRSTSKLAWCDEFRPIRTPEQIAADQKNKAIKEMQCLFGGGSNMTTHIFETLYNHGYRKFEIVEGE